MCASRRYDHEDVVVDGREESSMTWEGFQEYWRELAITDTTKTWRDLRRLGIGRSLGPIDPEEIA